MVVSTPLAPFIALRDAFAARGVALFVEGPPPDGPDAPLPASAGYPAARYLSAALDQAVRGLLPRDAGRVALVAVGGYGRGEMCLHSDVDLMLLHTGNVPKAVVDAVFYPLWDARLKVGHAVRTVREALGAAREELQTLTALLDLRLVAGDADLFGELRHALAEALRRGRLDPARGLTEVEAARVAAEPYLLQELHTKDGRGALRAMQSLHWVARARTLAGREQADPWAQPAFGEARDTLMATRNALHAVNKKAHETYVHELHGAVAEWLGVEVSAWSQRLYQQTAAADRVVRGFWEAQAVSAVTVAEPPKRGLRLSFFKRDAPPEAEPVQATAVPPEVSAPPSLEDPVLVLAARTLERPVQVQPFTRDEARAIRAAMGPMWESRERRAFLDLLGAGDRGRAVFDALDELGWAERALPEWAHVRGLPQYAPFHLHPVDAHLWRTVSETLALARRDSPEPRLVGVAAELDSLDDALLAALFHDIGKGWPGDHAKSGAVAARAICRRARFGPRTAATVARAIEHHLLLPLVATRRDLDDPTVIRDVADAVLDRRTLRILYLLSVADSRATGPAVWSPWKASLLHNLYERADDELRRREQISIAPRGVFDPEPLIAALRGTADETTVREHLAAMPPGYADSWSVEEMAQHLRLMWPAPGPGEVRLEVRQGGPAEDVSLAVEDRPGLLCAVSGVLALNNISVLGGRMATRSDGTALEVLNVVDVRGHELDGSRWERVRRDLGRVLAGSLDLETALQEKRQSYRRASRTRIPTRVSVNATASARATLVEVHTEDRVGLLHDITRALFEQGLDIEVAKVDTLGREVVDVFYVRDGTGHPPRDPATLTEIERQVRTAADAKTSV